MRPVWGHTNHTTVLTRPAWETRIGHVAGKTTAPQLAPSFLALAGHVTEGVALSREGRICWASPRLAELAGFRSAEALIGKSVDALLEAEPGAGEGEKPGKASASFFGHLRSPTGRSRRVLVHCPPGDEERNESIWVVQDVTHLQDLEQELLDVLSHELRTPVTVISGYLRLLLSEEGGALHPEQQRFLNECVKSCQRLDSFIESLLKASKGSSETEPVQLCSASIEPTIRGVVSFLRPLLEARELRVEIDLDPTALWASFDRVRIEQVLTNLLGNAIKHAKAGGSIGLATSPLLLAEQHFIEVRVSDEGPGVAPADRERIFEPYVRAGEGGGSGASEGLGLGLAISKRIVLQHGGTIGVVDRPGGGSCFRFSLQAAREAPPEE